MQGFEDFIIFWAKALAILFSAHLFITTIISIVELILTKNKDLVIAVVFKTILSVMFLFVFTSKYYLFSVEILAILFALAILFFKDWCSFRYILSKWKLKRKGYNVKKLDLTDMKSGSLFNPYDIPYESVLKKVDDLIAEQNYETLRDIRFVINDLTSLSEVQKKYLLNKINSVLSSVNYEN